MNLGHFDLDEYRRFRAILRRHHNAIVKTVPDKTFRQCARTLELLHGNKLELSSESDLTILYDYCIYSHHLRGRNLVQRFVNQLPLTEDNEEIAVRQAICRARYSIFQIERLSKHRVIQACDLVRGDKLSVVDESLSRTLKKGTFLGGRLIPLPDYWVTTGACFPLDPEIVDFIQLVLIPALKLTEGTTQTLSAEAEEELAITVIGAAIQSGATALIKYQ